VLEMRGVRTWSVAVCPPTAAQLAAHGRRFVPAGEIGVQTFDLDPQARRHRLLRLPIVRGIVALRELRPVLE
jgi:hypothetical protein